MGRRILAFFLGFLLGIIFVFGALAGAIYIAITVVHPSDIYPGSDKFLGDLAGMSLLDIYQSITDLYSQKVGIKGENGLYFTLGEFCEHYNINPNELFGGKEVPQDVLDLPVFELIGGGKDSDALEQVKVSAIFSFINMFTAGENGNGYFSQDLIAKMSSHNMAEFSEEDKGFAYIFSEVLISDILPSVFPTEKTADNAIMWALGQSSIGKLLGGMNGNILLQFKEEGAFEAMGSLKFNELLGDNSAILNAIFKNYTLSDIIDDEGGLNPDHMLGGVYLGDLLGCQRNQLNEDEVADYSEKYVSDDGERAVLSMISEGEESYVIRVSAVGENGYEYYKARLSCSIKEHTHGEECGEPNGEEYTCGHTAHSHDENCFSFIWYLQTVATTEADDDMIKDGVHYNRATGLYTAIADATIGELMSGNSDLLVNRVIDLKLGEVLEGQQTSNMIDGLKDMTIRQLMTDGIDGIYFGSLFGYVRKEIVSTDGYTALDNDLMIDDNGEVIKKDSDDKWYLAKLKCDEAPHEHSADCYDGDEIVCGKEEQHDSSCYDFVWYEDDSYANTCTGIKGALASTTVGGLNDINNTIKELTLIEVLGEDGLPSMLKSLGNTKIGKLGEEIDAMRLGDFLSYHRDQIATDDYEECGIEGVMKHKSAEDAFILEEDGNWYEAKYDCRHANDVDHEHDATCYSFVWYKCKSDEEEHTHNDKCIATGMMGKLANERVSNLGNLNDTIMTFTLYDVMGDKVPSMLHSIKDKQLDELGTAIDQMYLGDFLSYQREQITSTDEYEDSVEGVMKSLSNDKYIRKDDDGNWYEAKYGCKHADEEDHEHDATCYVFVWYKCKITDEEHVHSDECLATGVTGKLANEKVSNLGNLNDTIKTFTLYDVMGEDVPKMLKSIQNTPISNLNNALEGLYLGEMLEYNRLTPNNIEEYNNSNIDGIKQFTDDTNTTLYVKIDKDGNYYNAKLDCYVETHTDNDHDESCYKYMWYTVTTDENGEVYTEETSIMAKFANLTIGKMESETIHNVINNTTLGEIIPNADKNAMLSELKDVKILKVSTELNSLYVGTAMGYFREEAPSEMVPGSKTDDIITSNVNNNQLFFKWDENKNKYYYAQRNCSDTAHEHDATCYGYVWYQCKNKEHTHNNDECVVKGLNSKMSNLTMSDLSDGQSMSIVLKSLTIGDLIDSGMMDVGSKENEYKFAIIFCETPTHSCNDFPAHQCTLKGYFAYAAAQAADGNTPTAKEFWLHTHQCSSESQLSDDDVAHRDGWRNLSLSEFMTKLLNSL